MCGVRILTPEEYERLEDQITKPSLVKLVRVLLLTGMRYEEVLALKVNPDHYLQKDRSIWVRSGKLKASSPERYIPLTELGVRAVEEFLADKRISYPPTNIMMINLTKWAEKTGFAPLLFDQIHPLTGANAGKVRKNVFGLSVKTFRKSWENWLMTIYPDRTLGILKAQGHNATTALDHYSGCVFSNEDVSQIRAYVSGWKPS